MGSGESNYTILSEIKPILPRPSVAPVDGRPSIRRCRMHFALTRRPPAAGGRAAGGPGEQSTGRCPPGKGRARDAEVTAGQGDPDGRTAAVIQPAPSAAPLR